MVILYFFRIIQLINKRYGIFRSHFLEITHTTQKKNKKTKQKKRGRTNTLKNRCLQMKPCRTIYVILMTALFWLFLFKRKYIIISPWSIS